MKRGLRILPLLFLACATDNGDNVFGPTFGPNGGKDASADGAGNPSDDGGGATDGGGDDGTDGDASVACPASETIAVLAGGDASLTGAIKAGGGAWSGAAITGGSATSKPALVAFGTGYLGVTRGAGDVLFSTQWSGSWSVAASFGNAGVKGPPALTVVDNKAHVVYSAGNDADPREYAHGIHDGNAWNAANEFVGTNASTDHSFGTVGAGLGTAGTTAVFMENGTDYKLYARTFDSAWSASTQVVDAGSIGADIPAPPALVSATTAWDLVAVYVQTTTRRLSYATRDAGTKAWTDRGVIHDFATTNEPFTFARISSSSYVVAFRGQDNNGYYAFGTVNGSGGITWNAAQSIGGGAPVAVDATPAVAKGVCGDDAIVVYATSGTVKATRLRGTSWTPAEDVTGASGPRVAVATK